MTANIVETFPNSSVGSLLDADTLLFFVSGSEELSRSDGTKNGTFELVNFSEDFSEGSLRFFTKDDNSSEAGGNGKLLFLASENETGLEPWVSDGTAEGTKILKDINPTGSSNPQNFFNLNGTFFFTADDGVNDRALWKSDGTPEGTQLVADIDPASTGFEYFTDFNGTLFFEARLNTLNDPQLWKSDGTSEGTQLVKDFDFGLQSLTVAGDTLFVQHNSTELWKSDGTPEGTQLVAEELSASEFTGVGNTLFFINDYRVSNNINRELWKSDGTAEGTQLVKDIRPEEQVNGVPVNNGSNPANLTDVDGTLFFTADDGINGEALWKSDGTTEGTQLVKDIAEGEISISFDNFTHVNGTLYFTNQVSANDRELWQSDGTSEGTFEIEPDEISLGGDIVTDSFRFSLSYSLELTEFNDQLFFTGEAYSVETGNYEPALLTLSDVDDNDSSETVYRFFRPDIGVHFYTASEIERDAVLDLPNFEFENASYRSIDPLSGSSVATPVYRFLNQDTGVHLYTASETEKTAVEELPNYTFEGEAFYAYAEEAEGSIPIHRFYNPTIDAHFYTPSQVERESVETGLPNYEYESVAYYALPLEVNI